MTPSRTVVRAAAAAMLAGALAGCLGAPVPVSPGPAATSIRSGFRNIAEEAGLASFRHTDGGSGRKFFVEQMGSGVAILDYDGDGLYDLYFCSGNALPGYKEAPPGNRLYRNLGNGKFEDVTEKAGVRSGKYCIGVAVGDYDNDGDSDLYLCVFGGNVLYRNNGDGTFTDVTATARVGEARLSSSAAWGDFDGDGHLDLYVANYVKYRLDDDLWCSKFAGHKSYCGPTLYEGEADTLYRNNGDGTFTDVSVSAGIRAGRNGNGLGVLWFDYDGDGDQDIFVANDQSPNFLWENDGRGRFTEVAVIKGVAFGEEGNARAGMGVDSGDFDNDGRPDVLITNFSEESNALFRNEGTGFRDVAFATGMGAATLMQLGFGTGFLDYDRDGWLDLFFANGHVLDDIHLYSDSVTWAQPLQLFRNLGNGKFEDVSHGTGVAEGTWVGRGAAIGDLDNDGRPDVVVNVLRGAPLLLRNEAAADAHWLGLELKASWGNPLAIGALVTLKAGGITQMREVRANASYASSNDPRLLFGLGATARVDELRIRWPSGDESHVPVPQVDRYMKVEQEPTTGPRPRRPAAP